MCTVIGTSTDSNNNKNKDKDIQSFDDSKNESTAIEVTSAVVENEPNDTVAKQSLGSKQGQYIFHISYMVKIMVIDWPTLNRI